MLKIDLEDLIVNSIILDNKETGKMSILNSQVVNYQLELENKLQEKGIFYCIKNDDSSLRRLMEKNWLDIYGLQGDILYEVRRDISINDLYEIRGNLSRELIDILEDDKLKKSLRLDKKDKKMLLKK